MKILEGKRSHFTMVPNYIVRGGHDPRYLAVLFFITSVAGDNSECTHSLKSIGEGSGVARRNTVCEALDYWEKLGILALKRSERAPSSITTNFDWTRPSNEICIARDTSKEESVSPVILVAPQSVSPVIQDQDRIKKSNKEEAQSAGTPAKTPNPVALVIDVFVKAKSPVSFGNKTERSAVEWLIEQEGVEGATALAKKALSLIGVEFAPQALTPFVLKQKYLAVKRYEPKKANKGFNMVTI